MGAPLSNRQPKHAPRTQQYRCDHPAVRKRLFEAPECRFLCRYIGPKPRTPSGIGGRHQGIRAGFTSL